MLGRMHDPEDNVWIKQLYETTVLTELKSRRLAEGGEKPKVKVPLEYRGFGRFFDKEVDILPEHQPRGPNIPLEEGKTPQNQIS